jgi:hypothetical protein
MRTNTLIQGVFQILDNNVIVIHFLLMVKTSGVNTVSCEEVRKEDGL